MTIGKILKHKDIDTYRKLNKLCKVKGKIKKEIKLGDSIESLMKSNSYKRIGRRIRQVK